MIDADRPTASGGVAAWIAFQCSFASMALRELPPDDQSRSRRDSKHEQEDRKLVADRIARTRNADPQVDERRGEPDRHEDLRRRDHACSAGAADPAAGGEADGEQQQASGDDDQRMHRAVFNRRVRGSRFLPYASALPPERWLGGGTRKPRQTPRGVPRSDSRTTRSGAAARPARFVSADGGRRLLRLLRLLRFLALPVAVAHGGLLGGTCECATSRRP